MGAILAEDGGGVEDLPADGLLGLEIGVDEELDEGRGAAAGPDEAGLIG